MSNCLKTGGWVFLSDTKEYLYGDVYDHGPGKLRLHVMTAYPDNYRNDLPEGGFVWATISNVHAWDYTMDGNKIEGVIGEGVCHYKWSSENGYVNPIPTRTPFNPLNLNLSKIEKRVLARQENGPEAGFGVPRCITGGTVTGRFTGSKPNFKIQLPKRTPFKENNND